MDREQGEGHEFLYEATQVKNIWVPTGEWGERKVINPTNHLDLCISILLDSSSSNLNIFRISMSESVGRNLGGNEFPSQYMEVLRTGTDGWRAGGRTIRDSISVVMLIHSQNTPLRGMFFWATGRDVGHENDWAVTFCITNKNLMLNAVESYSTALFYSHEVISLCWMSFVVPA
jgi:hypothetical protein